MLLHVSKCFQIHAHTMLFFAHLPVGPPASALYLSKTLVAWAVYVQGPPHLLANLLTHPTKSSSLSSQKPLGLPIFQVLELGHLLEHVKLGFDPRDILPQWNGFSVQPTVLLTHSLAKPMNITSAPNIQVPCRSPGVPLHTEVHAKHGLSGTSHIALGPAIHQMVPSALSLLPLP